MVRLVIIHSSTCEMYKEKLMLNATESCKMFHREQPRYNSNVRAFATVITHNARKCTYFCCLLCRPKSSSTLSPRRHYFYQMCRTDAAKAIEIFASTRGPASAKVSVRLRLSPATTELILWLPTCPVFYKSASNSDCTTSEGPSQWPLGLKA
jgi:hypothetical protein